MADVTIAELQKKMGTAFEEFKKVNDERIVEIKELGEAKAATEEKLDKINTNMDTIQKRMDAAETAASRPPSGAPGEGKDEERTEYQKAFHVFLRKDKEGMTPEEKTLIVSDDETGGFLASDEMVNEIDKDIVEFSPIRAHAKVRTTGKRSVMLPRRSGTFTADWVAEAGQQTETEGLKYNRKQVHVHQLRALVEVSQEDLEDLDFNLEAELNGEFAEQFGVAEGLAFVNGNGVTRPEGFLTVAASGVTEQETAGSLVLAADDLIDLQFENLKSAYWPQASWLMNRKIIGKTRKLKDNDLQYLWQPGLNGPTQPVLLGFPVIEATDMADDDGVVGNQIALLGDIRRLYTIVDRVGMSVLRDPFSKSDQLIVRFIAHKRVGGQVVRAEAAVILKVKA